MSHRSLEGLFRKTEAGKRDHLRRGCPGMRTRIQMGRNSLVSRWEPGHGIAFQPNVRKMSFQSEVVAVRQGGQRVWTREPKKKIMTQKVQTLRGLKPKEQEGWECVGVRPEEACARQGPLLDPRAAGCWQQLPTPQRRAPRGVWSEFSKAADRVAWQCAPKLLVKMVRIDVYWHVPPSGDILSPS